MILTWHSKSLLWHKLFYDQSAWTRDKELWYISDAKFKGKKRSKLPNESWRMPSRDRVTLFFVATPANASMGFISCGNQSSKKILGFASLCFIARPLSLLRPTFAVPQHFTAKHWRFLLLATSYPNTGFEKGPKPQTLSLLLTQVSLCRRWDAVMFLECTTMGNFSQTLRAY